MYFHDYHTEDEWKVAVENFVYIWYNHVRPHSYMDIKHLLKHAMESVIAILSTNLIDNIVNKNIISFQVISNIIVWLYLVLSEPFR